MLKPFLNNIIIIIIHHHHHLLLGFLVSSYVCILKSIHSPPHKSRTYKRYVVATPLFLLRRTTSPLALPKAWEGKIAWSFVKYFIPTANTSARHWGSGSNTLSLLCRTNRSPPYQWLDLHENWHSFCLVYQLKTQRSTSHCGTTSNMLISFRWRIDKLRVT